MSLHATWQCVGGSVYHGALVDADINTQWRCEHDHDSREDAERCAETKLARDQLEAEYGKVWDTDQLREEFEVLNFLAPFCGVVRKADGKRGLLQFTHRPRFYFDFTEAR